MGRRKISEGGKKPDLKEEYIHTVRYVANPHTRGITIPCAMADKLGIEQGDEVSIRLLGDCVVMKKVGGNTNEADRGTEEAG